MLIFFFCIFIPIYFFVQLEELKLLPEKYEKDIEKMAGKLEKLEKEKETEEEHLKEVMESLKTETQVRKILSTGWIAMCGTYMNCAVAREFVNLISFLCYLQGLTVEKEQKEKELLVLQKAVNETKSKVCRNCSELFRIRNKVFGGQQKQYYLLF